MSKEKDLLKRVRDTLRELKETHYDLYWDIQAALDQPEQEPVGIVRTIGGYPDESDHIAEWTCSFKYLKDGDKLYLTPPKREPLSDEILYPIAEARINDEGIAGFYDGFRYAEKYYEIGE